MKHLFCLATLLAAALPPDASAADFDYEFVELDHFRGEIKESFPLAADFDGWELRGSKAFGNWLLATGYEDISFGPVGFFGATELSGKRTSLQLGGGRVVPVVDRLHVVVSAGFLRAETQTDIYSTDTGDTATERESDGGYFTTLGLRARLTDGLEAGFEHRFSNVFSERFNDQRIDLRYRITPAIFLGLTHRDFEGDTATGISLRWHY